MIRSFRPALLLVVSGLAACSDAKRPPPRSTASRPAGAGVLLSSTAPGLTPEKTEPKIEPAYSSAGKRDPFRPYLVEIDLTAKSLLTECKTPVGRFELEQLKLVAVITGDADPVAMVEGPNGIGYSIRKGDCIGKNGGTVAAVRSGEVMVKEFSFKADGTREPTYPVLKLPREAAINLQE